MAGDGAQIDLLHDAVNNDGSIGAALNTDTFVSASFGIDRQLLYVNGIERFRLDATGLQVAGSAVLTAADVNSDPDMTTAPTAVPDRAAVGAALEARVREATYVAPGILGDVLLSASVTSARYWRSGSLVNVQYECQLTTVSGVSPQTITAIDHRNFINDLPFVVAPYTAGTSYIIGGQFEIRSGLNFATGHVAVSKIDIGGGNFVERGECTIEYQNSPVTYEGSVFTATFAYRTDEP